MKDIEIEGDKIKLASFDFRWFVHSFVLCFRSLPRWKTKFCPIMQQPKGTADPFTIKQYFSFCKMPLICIKSAAISPLKHHHKHACPVGWGCKIYRLHLCRGYDSPPTSFPAYNTKQSDGEVPVMPEFWGMRSTPLLPSLPGSPWPDVVAPGKALSMA